LKSFTQKGIVEYLNLYYDRNLIKNSSRLSKHKQYVHEVEDLIKDYIDGRFWRYSPFLR